MRILYSIIVALFLTGCIANKQTKKTPRIKKINEQEFSINKKIEDFKVVDANRHDFKAITSSRYAIRDKKGDTLEHGSLTIEGEFFYKQLREYNDKGQKIKVLDVDKNDEAHTEN